MKWTQLSPKDAAEFISAVTDENEPALFDVSVCDVYKMPMEFYDGYCLYRIVNKYMIPHLTLDYASNGENHYYFNGSEEPFQNLNARHAISLHEKNVVDYLSLYISYVYERGNSLQFSHEAEDEKAIELKLIDVNNELYKLETELLYQGSMHKAHITVKADGSIHIETPLEVSFLENVSNHGPVALRHPLEDQIIQQSKDLLAHSETGQKLLETLEFSTINIRVLGNANYHSFVTNSGTIYIVMPAAEQNAKYLQALVLAWSLHDLEQVKAGYIHPHPTTDEHLYVDVNYSKNLDMLMETCKIVEELENKGLTEGLGALKRLGLESVYEGHKDGLLFDDLMEIYIKALKRRGFLS